MSAFKKPRRSSGRHPASLCRNREPNLGRAGPQVSLSNLEPRIVELLTMLTYKRPASSKAEADFIARYVTSLGCHLDGYGNSWLVIPNADGSRPDILWSSHTDTVHKTSGSQRIDYAYGVAMSQSGECLGADCTTGVWIMRQMVLAKVPGHYVFHLDEEIGGLGSAWVAKHDPKRLEDIRFAVALDRKGLGDVITDQFTDTASDEFAGQLADILNKAGLNYSPSSQGIFTDTANYAEIIPECTNLSVGYFSAHGPMESQDIPHACRLADALINSDLGTLEVHRDPAESWGRYSRFDPWDDVETSARSDSGGDLADYVFRNPGDVTEFLEYHGFTVEDIDQFNEGSFRR